MADVKRQADRVLRTKTLSSGQLRKGISGYFSFSDGERPSWWSERFEQQYGAAIGVLENYDSSSRDALVVANDRVCVLGPNGEECRFVRYEDVENFLQLSKEPVSEEIAFTVVGSKAREVLPVLGKNGRSFTFMRFFVNACREYAYWGKLPKRA